MTPTWITQLGLDPEDLKEPDWEGAHTATRPGQARMGPVTHAAAEHTLSRQIDPRDLLEEPPESTLTNPTDRADRTDPTLPPILRSPPREVLLEGDLALAAHVRDPRVMRLCLPGAQVSASLGSVTEEAPGEWVLDAREHLAAAWIAGSQLSVAVPGPMGGVSPWHPCTARTPTRVSVTGPRPLAAGHPGGGLARPPAG